VSEIVADYVELIEKFLQKSVSATEFKRLFLKQFKCEVRALSEAQYQILDTLFGDVDSLSFDEALIASNPDFYIDEGELFRRAQRAALLLKDL
jgi:hypothetical protein